MPPCTHECLNAHVDACVHADRRRACIHTCTPTYLQPTCLLTESHGQKQRQRQRDRGRHAHACRHVHTHRLKLCCYASSFFFSFLQETFEAMPWPVLCTNYRLSSPSIGILVGFQCGKHGPWRKRFVVPYMTGIPCLVSRKYSIPVLCDKAESACG